MGLRFRKSIKIAPGVKLNIGKKSMGVSLGGKRGGLSFNTRSGARARISLPETGLSYSTKLNSGRSKRSSSNRSKSKHQTLHSSSINNVSDELANMRTLTNEEKYKSIATKHHLTEKSLKSYRTCFITLAVIGFIIGIPSLAFAGVGIVFIIISCICLYYANLYKKIQHVCYPKMN